MIKQVLTVTGLMLMTANLALAGTDTGNTKHYMMLPGDGPQSYMMQGTRHPGQPEASSGQEQVAGPQHYMMLGGEGPQGYMMPGERHPGTAKNSAQPVHTAATTPRHYMMLPGDGPQGYWMEGDEHHC